MTTLSRRDFIKLATNGLLVASGMLGAGALLRFLAHPAQLQPKTEFDLGPVESFPAGSRTMLADIPAVLYHTQAGFSAMSLVCTHLGCTLEQHENGFECPCHGSRFGADGALERGPSDKGLVPLPVEVTADGRLILYRTQE